MSEGRSASDKPWLVLDSHAEALDGEDPGRYLDGPLPALPRIRGIRTRERLGVFRAAERKLGSIRNREPRSEIMDALAERERELEAGASFDPELPERESQVRLDYRKIIVIGHIT